MLEPCDAKVSCTVLRGLGDRKVSRLLGKTGKVLTCWTRSGVPKLFAFSGRSNAAAALFAIPKSLVSRAGAFITAFLS